MLRFYHHYESADYWEGILKINDYQIDRLSKRIINEFKNKNQDSKISILGWSFKKNTNDSRESPSIYLVKSLLVHGFNISVYDPKVSHENIITDLKDLMESEGLNVKKINEYTSRLTININSNDSLKEASVIVILTEWDEFANYNWHGIYNNCSEQVKIYDTRLILDRKKILKIGFELYQIGI
jgi:UDPglucose 6-dehydrogenase